MPLLASDLRRVPPKNKSGRASHLKVLERAGLISMDVDAQRRPRRLEPKGLKEAVDWIERYREIFEQNYQRLDALLGELQAKPSRRKQTNK